VEEVSVKECTAKVMERIMGTIEERLETLEAEQRKLEEDWQEFLERAVVIVSQLKEYVDKVSGETDEQ
jgi:chemotaxis regulatin CheY-phosphate phosphatase CheZ